MAMLVLLVIHLLVGFPMLIISYCERDSLGAALGVANLTLGSMYLGALLGK